MASVFGVLAVSPAVAADTASTAGFEQPSLPLAEALRRFGLASGFDVVFPEALVRDLKAPAVKAGRDHHAALAQILAGSGLVARFTRPDAFILERIVETPPAADLSLDRIEILSPVLDDRSAEYRWYGDKLLQASLQTLRRSRELGMLSYDLTVYLWVSDAGTVTSLEGVSRPDQQEILHTAIDILRGLAVDSLPPPNMPQPVGLRITAQ